MLTITLCTYDKHSQLMKVENRKMHNEKKR